MYVHVQLIKILAPKKIMTLSVITYRIRGQFLNFAHADLGGLFSITHITQKIKL